MKKYKTALIVLLVGCLFFGYGIYRGEQNTVMKKSNMVCMECVGIG